MLFTKGTPLKTESDQEQSASASAPYYPYTKDRHPDERAGEFRDGACPGPRISGRSSSDNVRRLLQLYPKKGIIAGGG